LINFSKKPSYFIGKAFFIAYPFPCLGKESIDSSNPFFPSLRLDTATDTPSSGGLLFKIINLHKWDINVKIECIGSSQYIVECVVGRANVAYSHFYPKFAISFINVFI